MLERADALKAVSEAVFDTTGVDRGVPAGRDEAALEGPPPGARTTTAGGGDRRTP